CMASGSSKAPRASISGSRSWTSSSASTPCEAPVTPLALDLRFPVIVAASEREKEHPMYRAISRLCSQREQRVLTPALARHAGVSAATVAGLSLLLAGCGAGGTSASTPSTPAPSHYVAHVTALNGSGIAGVVDLWVNGTSLTVSIQATGLEPGQRHFQH